MTGSAAMPSVNPPALVVRIDRGSVTLDHGGTLVRAHLAPSLLAATAADPEAGPCTGDRVAWHRDEHGRPLVDAVAPRRSLLSRSGAARDSRRQLLAANADTVAVVEALMPDPDRRRIDRLLTLAWSSGADPVVLLTKADLAPDADRFAAELAAVHACPVVAVSTVDGRGVGELAGRLAAGQVVALLGASGAGKSSLVNVLAGGELMRVQALRGDGKGRHTTVTRELHPVGGGWVIDGPGLRSVGLAGAEGLAETFADVAELAAACRFRDCGHDGEPGCAVGAAVAEGTLPPDRLLSWRRLVAEGRYEARRRDARLRAEHTRRLRSLHRGMRGRGRP